MKKIIFFLIIVVIAGWALQNYSSVKVFDYAKNYWQRIDWTALKNFRLPNLNTPVATPIPGKQLNVFIRDVGFVPNNSGLEAGGKVTWYNEDGRAHAIIGEGWDSGGAIAPDKAFSRVFDIAGAYLYHSSVDENIKGKITVQ